MPVDQNGDDDNKGEEDDAGYDAGFLARDQHWRWSRRRCLRRNHDDGN